MRDTGRRIRFERKRYDWSWVENWKPEYAKEAEHCSYMECTPIGCEGCRYVMPGKISPTQVIFQKPVCRLTGDKLHHRSGFDCTRKECMKGK